MNSEFESISTGVAAHIGRYADAVRIPASVEVIHTSGTPGLRPDGTLPDDFSEEVAQAWRNVEVALGRAGATLADIVSVRQWLTNADDLPAYAAVRSKVITHIAGVHARDHPGVGLAEHPCGNRSHSDSSTGSLSSGQCSSVVTNGDVIARTRAP